MGYAKHLADGARLGLATYSKKLKCGGIKRLLERALGAGSTPSLK